MRKRVGIQLHAGHNLAHLGRFAPPLLPDGWIGRALQVSAPEEVYRVFRAMNARERGLLVIEALTARGTLPAPTQEAQP